MHTDESTLVILSDFFIPQLNRSRTVRIYLPIGYEASSKRYPVLYMHDGQNVFEENTATYGMSWKVRDTLDAMQNSSKQDGMIVVAVDSSDELDKMSRYDEYSPYKASEAVLKLGIEEVLLKHGGEGNEYLAFICETLKPYIDGHYRTNPQRESTYLAGSSMGGLISLYGGIKYQQVFSSIGVFSPAFWFNYSAFFKLASEAEFGLPMTIYMDMGTNEKRDGSKVDFAEVYLSGSRDMKTLLEDKSNVSLFYVEGEGHEHNEIAWAERFPVFIRSILDHQS